MVMPARKRGRSASSVATPSKKTKVDPATDILTSSDAEDAEDAEDAVKQESEEDDADEESETVETSGTALVIPVDDHCPLSVSHQVYLADDGDVYDVTLNQTNSANNNNKFYRMQLLVSADYDYLTWTRWGRIGERGSNSTSGDGSLGNACFLFKKKFREKTGLTWETRLLPPKPGKYVLLDRNYETEASQETKTKHDLERGNGYVVPVVESNLPKPVQRLMEFMFNPKYMEVALQALDYDPSKMPLGKLSKRTITQAYDVLRSLSEELAKPLLDMQAVQSFSNLYLSLIPHDFGRTRPPTISDMTFLKRELTLLDSLSDMKVADEIMKSVQESGVNDMHPLDRHFQGLQLKEMVPLKENTKEFKELKKYLLDTRGDTHHIRYGKVEIFRLERAGEAERYVSPMYQRTSSSDRRLLWHGSRVTNFGGILSTGLRIAPPEAPVNGYMFAKGIYLADMSTKSANYCVPSISGKEGLLLLCEAELGDPMLELVRADSFADVHAKQQGAIATFGKGRTAPRTWKDAKCVHSSLRGVKMPDTSSLPTTVDVPGGSLMYDEYIVYDIKQVRQRYLFRVEMT